MIKALYLFSIFLFVITSALLLLLNIYGLFFKSLRSPGLYSHGKKINIKEFEQSAVRINGESDKDFAARVTKLVHGVLTHINWKKCNIEKYYLRIPPWENYILFLLSYLPGDQIFKRYHFCNYLRTVERGIANCADASIILSHLLENNDMKVNIVAFPEHVMVEAKIDAKNDIRWVFDADLGVVLPYSIEKIIKNPALIVEHYIAAGCSKDRIGVIERTLAAKPKAFLDHFEFSPKRAIFEDISYALIWLIPIFLIAVSIIIFERI